MAYGIDCLSCSNIRKTDNREVNIYYCDKKVKIAREQGCPIPAFGSCDYYNNNYNRR